MTGGRTRTCALAAIVLALYACAAALAQEVAPDAARVETKIDGRLYTWRVTNVAAPPITRLEIPAELVYNIELPDGWVLEEHPKIIIARTDDPGCAIPAGQSKEFSARAVSSGSVLAAGTARLGFGQTASLEVPGILTAHNEHWTTTMIPPLVIGVIAVVQVLLMRRRAGRQSRASAADAGSS
jgi:hypothetical protein